MFSPPWFHHLNRVPGWKIYVRRSPDTTRRIKSVQRACVRSEFSSVAPKNVLANLQIQFYIGSTISRCFPAELMRSLMSLIDNTVTPHEALLSCFRAFSTDFKTLKTKVFLLPFYQPRIAWDLPSFFKQSIIRLSAVLPNIALVANFSKIYSTTTSHNCLQTSWVSS